MVTLLDSRGQPIAARSAEVVPIRDGLANVVSGLGTGADKRSYGNYFRHIITQHQIDAAYRGSWLMRKGVNLPPTDITRAWRDWQADKAQIELIEAEERRLDLRAKIKKALILGRLGGGALVLGLSDSNPTAPVPEAAAKGALSYVHVMSRWRLTLGDPIMDPASPDFGRPAYYQINGTTQKIHPSRVVEFCGETVPDLGVGDWQALFWGDSLIATVLEAVKNADSAQGNFASLIDEAKLDVYAIPGLTERASTAQFEAGLTKRMQTAALFKSTYNALLIDAGSGQSDGSGESWSTRQITWAGITDILMAYLQIVAAAFDVPATRMLNKSPDGMNATGAADSANYYEMLDGYRDTDLRPKLDRIDAFLVPSAIGQADPDVGWTYGEFSVPTDKEKADIAKTKAETTKIYADSGLVPTIALEKGVQNQLVEDGTYPGLDGALAELDEEERFPSLSEPDPAEDPLLADPSTLQAGNDNPAAVPRRRAANDTRFTDAAPKTLYVQRKLLNADEFIRWAKGQGFATATPADELHVTIAFSRAALDWMKIGQDWSAGSDGTLTVQAGGPRIVERLGDKGAVVLLFASPDLTWRHRAIREAGASFDFDEYQPHVTITYSAPADFDPAKVEPYVGPLKFGPELFSEVVEDWEKGVTEE